MFKQKKSLPNVLPLETVLDDEYTIFCNLKKVYDASEDPDQHLFLSVEDLIDRIILPARLDHDWKLLHTSGNRSTLFLYNKELKMFIQKNA